MRTLFTLLVSILRSLLALQYVLGGNLEHEYPQYAGAPVLFRLECAEVPGEQEVGFFDAIVKFAAQENVEFVVVVKGAV
jgi:hypothetical protein